MNFNKIPATVVTGFLGSGKTTLLSTVIQHSRGQKIAAIVNEFGEMNIDAEILRNCPLDCKDDTIKTSSKKTNYNNDEIYELTNGCICCTVEEEFLPVMKQIVRRKQGIDHILIETSGLALPKPLVEAFNWPDIKQYCTVDSIITVVDGPAVIDGRIVNNPDLFKKEMNKDLQFDHNLSIQQLLEDQLASADMVIISKSDLITINEISLVKKLISNFINPEVKMIEISHGNISSNLIMGLARASEEQIHTVHTHHDHHDNNEGYVHAHDYFQSLSIQFGEVDGDLLLKLLGKLFIQYNIFRVKGFLSLPGKPMRQVVNGVGKRFDRHFDRLWKKNEDRHTKLVFIGLDLDKASLTKVLQPALIESGIDPDISQSSIRG